MITIKSKKEIELLREGGKVLARVLKYAAKAAQRGASLEDIDAIAEKIILEHEALPAFKGYCPEGAVRPYPAATCLSVNEIIVHGIPSGYKIKKGDVVKIDAGVIYGGLYTDSAVTIGVGAVSQGVKKMIEVCKKALAAGIKKARVGNTTGDIGCAVHSYVKRYGFRVIKNLTGHGVGYAVHEDPIVYNFGVPGSGIELQDGMVIAIEPMISFSSEYAMQNPDDSFTTHDGSLSAHFEHTVAVTKKGPWILTQ